MNLLPVLTVAFGLAAPSPKEAPKKVEPATIVGKWECTKIVAGGQTFSEEEAKQIDFEFAVDGTYRNQFGPETSKGKYTMGAAKDPAELDIVPEKTGMAKGGIYKVEKDTLTLCFAEGAGARPTKFESPAGTRIMLMTCKRVEKKKE